MSLGQLISFENQTEKEIKVVLVWQKYWNLKEIIKNREIKLHIKGRLYEYYSAMNNTVTELKRI